MKAAGDALLLQLLLSSIDKAVRFRDLEKVKQELRFFLDRNVSQVKFVDRTFKCETEPFGSDLELSSGA